MKKKIVVVLAACLGVMCLVKGCGNSENEAQVTSENVTDDQVVADEENNGQNATANNDAQAVVDESNENTVDNKAYVDEQGRTHLQVGGALSISGRIMSFVSANPNYIPTDGTAEYMDSGYKVVKMTLDLDNTSDTEWYVNFMNFSCYADGYEMEYHQGLEDTLDAAMSAGRKAKGDIYFEVPVNAQEIEVEYSIGGGEVIILDIENSVEAEEDASEWWGFTDFYREDEFGITLYQIDETRYYFAFGNPEGTIDVRDVEFVRTGYDTLVHNADNGSTLNATIDWEFGYLTIEQSGYLPYCDGIDFSGYYVGRY